MVVKSHNMFTVSIFVVYVYIKCIWFVITFPTKPDLCSVVVQKGHF